MNLPALIACDLDGTLLSGTLGQDPKILPATRAALLRATERGSRLALASGRPVRGLQVLADQMGLDRRGLLLLAANGSIIADAETGRVTWDHPIESTLWARLLAHARTFPVTIMVSEGDKVYVEDADGFMAAEEPSYNGQELAVLPCLDDLPVPAHKVLFAAPHDVLAPISDAIAAPFAGELDFSFSVSFYFECTVAGVDKGSALRRCCESLGIDLADTVAFGDNENDVAMLRTAGLGVAMANGVPAALAAADVVTLSNDEDGIAVLLAERFGI